MISGTFVGGNAKVIIPLRDKKSIYKYCQEQKYDTSLPLSCDSSIGLKYTLSFIPKSNEQSNYFILLNLNEDLLKMFIEKEITLDEIVCIVEESEKLDDYELFLCCLYYFHNYTNLENFEYALESFSCKIEDDEDYPKAIRKYIGNIENYKTINAKKDLIQIIFGECINNSELLTYINIDTILDDLHTIEFEDKIYLFNPKQ